MFFPANSLNLVQPSYPRDPGSPKLRMVSWHPKTMHLGAEKWGKEHPNQSISETMTMPRVKYQLLPVVTWIDHPNGGHKRSPLKRSRTK